MIPNASGVVSGPNVTYTCNAGYAFDDLTTEKTVPCGCGRSVAAAGCHSKCLMPCVGVVWVSQEGAADVFCHLLFAGHRMPHFLPHSMCCICITASVLYFVRVIGCQSQYPTLCVVCGSQNVKGSV